METVLDYAEQISPMFELKGELIVLYFLTYMATDFRVYFDMWRI